MIQVNLFGNLHISIDGKPVKTVNTNRLQSLLGYLLLHVEGPQRRDALAFTLWPASREAQARTNLRQLVHNLRRALPAECDCLLTDHFAVQWRADNSCRVDAWEFQSAIAGASMARKASDRTGEIACLTTATTLYADDLLPALYDDWVPPFRDKYRRSVCEALDRLASIWAEQADYVTAISYADRLLVLNPLGEAHHQLVMRLHASNRDRASALRAYHKCMRVLRHELGVEPSSDTRNLFEQILKDQNEALHKMQSPPEAKSAARAAAEAQGAGAMVGRRSEWSRLMLACEAAVADGPRVAVISGEPGIGKTRLADEVYQWCIRQGYGGARGRCYSGQVQASYSPITELLRSESVCTRWAEAAPHDRIELARIVPEINAPLPERDASGGRDNTALPENWQRLRLYESLNRAIGKSRKPLVLYLDDLQWCDADTFEWLGAFLASPESTSVLVLANVRSEEIEREHPFARFVAGLRRSDILFEVALERLNAEETAELASRESAKPLAGEKLAEIFRATRGNPLFVLETVRAGLQSQRVHAVIAARLGRLSAGAYELAAVASAVGRPFSVELIQKAVDWDEGSVFDALDELWRRRIVEAYGAAEYDFTHDLLREAAYSELSPIRQRYLHRRLARALGEVYQENIDEWRGQIGWHFEKAGLVEAAIESFQQAASHARQRYADSEAVGLLRRALLLCRSLPESDGTLQRELALLLMLGPVLVTTEAYSAPEVGATYERALALSRRFDGRDIFVILNGSFVFHVVRGDLEAARHCGAEFLTRAEEKRTARLMLAGNFFVGCALFHLGQLWASLHHMNEACRLFGDANDPILELSAGPDTEVFCRAYLAHLAWHCGDEEQSVAKAVDAVRIAKRLHHPFSEAIALAYAAMLHVFRGDSVAACENALEAIEVCSRYGFTYYLAMAGVLLGWARAAQGDVAGGLERTRTSLDEMRRLGAELRLPFYLKLLADMLGRAGNVREALANVSTAFAIVSKNGEAWALPELHLTQGELLMMQGKSEQAHVCFERGLEAARQCGSLALQRRLSSLFDGTAENSFAERL